MPPSPTTATAADLTLLEKAALLSGADVWRTRALPRLGVPAIWLADGPHGLRKQPGDADHLGLGESERAVCFPTAATVANSWDEALAEEVGAALGREAAARDVHVLLGPGLNIKRDPRGGRNFEYLSEDPELAGRLAAAYVRGIQSQGVAATPKHFAANSQELRRLVSDSVVDEQTLHELYLTAFEIVVREARPWALMSAYNRVNGTYAHQHHHLLTEVLREDWGFDGVVVSDWGGCADPVASVRAGGTLEMPSPGFDSVRALLDAVRRGDLAEADLDVRVEEVLRLVRRVTARPGPGRAAASDDAHHALARRAAGRGAVLLRNVEATLPLPAGTRVALVGELARTPRYQGAGSSLVNPTHLTTLLGAVADTDLVLTAFAPGYRLPGTRPRGDAGALRAEAVRAARDADVVVLALGLPATDESEGLDRPHLRLPADQVATLRAVAATGTPVVVVLSGGGPVETPWLDATAALLHTYLGGQAGAEAAWDVLTGAVDPGGRLAETMPVSVADLPTADTFPSDARTAVYEEGTRIGYRSGTTPAFPFGFGLSYTTFAYADLRVDGDAATLDVTNTGDRPGTDVVQLYARHPDPGRCPRLVGFTVVDLTPGERTTVRLPLGERTFRTFDTATHRWVVEAGEYTLLAGRSSADLPLRATLHVPGTATRGVAVPAVPAVPVLPRPIGTGASPTTWPPGVFDVDTPLDHVRTSRTLAGRALAAYLALRRRAAARATHPDLDALFVVTAPFRVIHTMAAGAATREVTDAVLLAVGRSTPRGLVALVRALVRGRRAERRTARAFARASGADPGRGVTARR